MRDFGLAVWSHNISDFGGRDDIEEHADGLAEGQFDIVIPCVKNPPGAVDFITDAADVNPDYPDWDPLKVLIDACQDRGVDVHPWFCVFPEGDQSRLLREHPEFAAELEGDRRWACACRDEVQDYAFDLYKSLAVRYRPAGLHLDYIRSGGICRCDYCKEQMAQRGVDIDEVEPRDPEFEEWTNWRASRLTDFVRRLYEFAQGEDMDVSAAVFAGYPDSIRSQAQDWVEWAEEGIVDYLFPMNYTNSLRVAVTRTISHIALVGTRVPVWEGLGKSSSASGLTTDALMQQVEGVLDAGADGIVLFSYAGIEDEDIEAIGRFRGE